MDIGAAFGIFGFSVFAGLLGSMLGMGGGIIIIPVLTLIYHTDMRVAAATSLLCVVANSVAGTSAYLRHGYTDIRLGLLLELPTVLGAIAGGYLAIVTPENWLRILFSLLILYTSYAMWRNSRQGRTSDADVSAQAVETEQGFSLPGSYRDPVSGQEITYRSHNFGWGMFVSTGAGIISGLLGVGGGIIKVPVMRLRMKVPMKVAAATSNFMIGITAATSVMLYYRNGYVDMPITAVCTLGILLGATLGPRLVAKMPTMQLQRVFVLLMLFTAIQMLWRALRGGG